MEDLKPLKYMSKNCKHEFEHIIFHQPQCMRCGVIKKCDCNTCKALVEKGQ